MNSYFKTSISSNQEWFDIFTAILSDIDYDMFEQTDDQLFAYIKEENFNQTVLEEALLPFNESFEFSYHSELVPYQNWNSEWESNYQPVVIDFETIILAPFHSKDLELKNTLIIQPQMSFGTGHHATTHTMMVNMKSIDFEGKSVLDFGSGTGVLAIYAAMLGAKDVFAIDYDEQSVQNTKENIELNNSRLITVLQGDIRIMGEKMFDIILANITRNTIIEFISEISTQLNMGGYFICSGVFNTQLEDIIEGGKLNSLDFQSSIEKDGWVSAIFIKTHLPI